MYAIQKYKTLSILLFLVIWNSQTFSVSLAQGGMRTLYFETSRSPEQIFTKIRFWHTRKNSMFMPSCISLRAPKVPDWRLQVTQVIRRSPSLPCSLSSPGNSGWSWNSYKIKLIKDFHEPFFMVKDSGYWTRTALSGGETKTWLHSAAIR